MPAHHGNSKARGLPVQRDSFIGREEETAAVLSSLHSARLVTVVGPGGTGKTRLAAEVTAAVADDYEDGAWFVELAPVREDHLVADRIRSSLRAPLPPGVEAQDALAAHLAPVDALLVLDNCEQVLDGVATVVDRILDAAPRLRVLTTSRSALGVQGETVHALRGLTVRDRGEPSDATALFAERARAVVPAYNADQLEDVAALCRRLEGSPLAIELAAARVVTLSPREILERLGERIDILRRRGASGAERHGSLRSAIEWSHDLLGPPEQVAFRRASAFARSFTLPAAESVCSGPGVGPHEVVDLVDELVGKSLLVAERRGSTTRYRMNEATRIYARERLLDADEGQAVAARHRSWYRQIALSAEPHLRGPALSEWLEALDDDIDDLRLAMRSGLRDGEPSVAMEIATSLLEYWMVRGDWKEGQEWLNAALESRSSDEPALVFRCLESSAVLADLVGDYALSEARAKELVQLAGAASDRPFEVRGLRLLGGSHFRRGNDALGRSVFEKAIAILGESDDASSRMRTLATEAELAEAWPDARRLREEYLELARVEGDPQVLAAALLNVGLAARAAGDPEAATAAFEEALTIARGLAYDRFIARATMCLGELAMDAGDTDKARPLLEQAASMWPQVGHLNGEADSLLDLAELARLDGDLREADSTARRALAMSQRLSIRRHEAEARRALAAIARQRGDLDAARRFALESARLSAAVPDDGLVARALEVLGGVMTDEGSVVEAARLFGVASGVRERLGLALTSVEAAVLARDGRRAQAMDESAWQASFDSARLIRLEDVLISLGIDTGSPHPHRTAKPASNSRVPALFRREGSHVTLAFGGPPFTLPATKGTGYLERLLRRQGEEVHVLTLTGSTDSSSGPMIDDQTREQYRLRLEDLREDAAEAESFNDPERAARAQAEIERLASELSRAVGIGGRSRLAHSAAERARLNVTRAIRSTISRIAAHDPRMGHHLDAAVRTGTYCSYVNDPVTPVTWSLGPD